MKTAWVQDMENLEYRLRNLIKFILKILKKEEV